ncbi:MAG: pimeloyl-ACP methyl ester carboxylesterase [Psychroserpens sp.]|jgi:pimeloyl-ACP methyl ester carboxylesterase
MKKPFVKFKILLLFTCILYINCSDNSELFSNSPQMLSENTRGAGYFEYASFNSKVLKVYYHVPLNINSDTKILFIFHGNGRNAKDYRDAMVAKANQYNFIVITPEFSNVNFPGGDTYNLGNVFIDGDNPSLSTLNPEEEWTFSIIEPLFDYVKQNINNNSLTYHLYGHSAGGQVAHRFLMYKPNARYDHVVASASGWYTATDLDVVFPYGFVESPLETTSLSDLFLKKLIIQIGSLDNDPNASALRHNEFADLQGLHRLERAKYFFNKAALLATTNNLECQWEFHINEGADHRYEIASQNAADLIFN